MALKCLISTSSFGKQSPELLERLRENGIEVTLNPFGRKLRKRESLELYREMDVAIAGVEELDGEVLEAAPKLKIISRCGIGTDSVDLVETKRRGITVTITPEPPAQAVAELTLGLIFAAARHIPAADQSARRKEWKPLMGRILKGKTLGILGFGRVGQKVATVMRALGMEILAYDPFLNADALAKVSGRSASLDEVVAGADVLSLHLPLLDSTRGLFGESTLKSLKPSAILINTSRGGIIDESALCALLESGHVAAAALDVFEVEPYEGPLLERPNAIITCHMGSYAQEARIEMEHEAVENLLQECLRQNLIS